MKNKQYLFSNIFIMFFFSCNPIIVKDIDLETRNAKQTLSLNYRKTASGSSKVKDLVSEYNLKTRKIVLEYDKLPKIFNGFKVGVLADIHVRYMKESYLNKIVNAFKQNKVDVIIFAGDLVSYHVNEINSIKLSILKKLQSYTKYGVYSILGNHDYGTYKFSGTKKSPKNYDQLMEETHKKLGWKLLKNSHAIIKRGTSSIKIVGIEHLAFCSTLRNRGDYELANKFCSSEIDDKKFAHSNNEGDQFTICAAHDPDVWDAICNQYDVPLVISGHTHGQPKTAEFSLFNPRHIVGLARSVKTNSHEVDKIKSRAGRTKHKYYGGLYTRKENNNYLYVDKGAGFSGASSDNIKLAGHKFSLDFVMRDRGGIDPEITIITLKKKNIVNK